MKSSMQEALRIPLEPYPLQREILQAVLEEPEVRVVSVGTGRQAGKTEVCKMAAAEMPPRNEGYVKVHYGAPTYERAGKVYEEMCLNLAPLIKRKRDSILTLELRPYGRNKEGARLGFHSLEKHDNLRGDNSDLWIVDEMCDVTEGAWRATILPMLMARRGKALLLGTPRMVGVGFAWARAEWLKGKDRVAFPTHRCFSAPSWANPANTPEAIRLMASNMTEDTYKEEILGEWLEHDGAVFERIAEAFVLPFVPVGKMRWRHAKAAPEPDHKYIIGFDIGAHTDFNIFSVWDLATREQVDLWRVRGEDHDHVLEMLHGCKMFWNNATIYADGNGMGLPIVARMAKRYGQGVVDRKWTSNALKMNDVTAARLLFQQQDWRFLDVPWQRAEFQSYTREKRPSGIWDYHAPEGGHDDAVAAACMVAERVKLEWRPSAFAQPKSPGLTVEGGEMRITSDWFDRREAQRKGNSRKWPHKR